MKLYIKQKVFALKDKFSIFDEYGEVKYYAEGELFSLGKKLHIKDNADREVILIKQRIASFLPKYEVTVSGSAPFEIVKNFRIFKHEYTINDLDIRIHGDFIAHNYSVERNGSVIATLTKEWLSWGDSYTIEISDPRDELTALAVILVVDCCMESAQNG